jgi:hypothetical protein
VILLLLIIEKISLLINFDMYFFYTWIRSWNMGTIYIAQL